MRRRSTFIHSSIDEVDPTDIQLKNGGRQLLYPGLKAAREERLTFGLSDEKNEVSVIQLLRPLLQQSHELHIRWSPEIFPGSVTPFASRLTAGLHVHYTPLLSSLTGMNQTEGTGDEDDELLCPLLKQAFSHDLKCRSVESSFTRPDVLSDRFAASASYQYYSVLPSLNQFVAYVQRHVCSQMDQQCYHDAALLNIVDYLDLDYDSISHALTLTAFWSRAPPAIYDPVGQLTTLDQWPIDITSRGNNNKVEVGILGAMPPPDPHDMQLGGHLTVLGGDDNDSNGSRRPKATQFSFPSRHHLLTNTQAAKQAYKISFQTPTGLHPTLKIDFPSAAALSPPSNIPADSICALHAYLTLPSSIFVDEYAFSAKDPLFERSHRLRALRSVSGELDLEAPDYVVDKWGSTLLLEIATPDSPLDSDNLLDNDSWNVTVPLHLRYRSPLDDNDTGGDGGKSGKGDQDRIHVPWPILFWACTAEEGTKFFVNPFDRVNLGYDGLFGPRTMFFHLMPDSPKTNRPPDSGVGGSVGGANHRLMETISVPVLDTSKVGGDAVVEWVTILVVMVGFGWVLGKVWPALRSGWMGGGDRKTTSGKEVRAKQAEKKEKKAKKEQ